MSAELNPYAAPQAVVAGAPVLEEFQEVRLFTTAGRVGRIRYLGYITGVYLLLAMVLGGLTAGMIGMGMRDSPVLWAVLGVAYAGMLVFVVFLAIQRCHDCDNSAWWVLLMVVPAINLILILYLLFMPGTAGPNRFGAPTPPNAIGVTVLACVFPILMAVGIIAAIALPAYQARHSAGHVLRK